MDQLFKTLGDITRLRIINLLSQEKLCVCELEIILDINQSNVSRHLSRLRNEKIIGFEKQAQWIYYFINPRFIEENMLLHQYLSEKTTMDDRFLQDISRLQTYLNSSENCETLKNKGKDLFSSLV